MEYNFKETQLVDKLNSLLISSSDSLIDIQYNLEQYAINTLKMSLTEVKYSVYYIIQKEVYNLSSLNK